MKKKLLAAAVTLVVILSPIVPVYAGPGSGGTGWPPPPGPTPAGITLPIDCCDAYADYCDC